MFELTIRIEKPILISTSLKFDSQLETVCDYTFFCHICAQSGNYFDNDLNASDICLTKQFKCVPQDVFMGQLMTILIRPYFFKRGYGTRSHSLFLISISHFTNKTYQTREQYVYKILNTI